MLKYPLKSPTLHFKKGEKKMEAKKLNIGQIENVIKYYVLMAKWLYELGDFARTKYLQMNLEKQNTSRPHSDYQRLLEKYYNGSEEELKFPFLIGKVLTIWLTENSPKLTVLFPFLIGKVLTPAFKPL